MAPLPFDTYTHSLEKRLFWGGYYGDGGNSNWYDWGRWVLLGVIVGVAVLFLVCLQVASCRRVRNGQQAVPGTGWMVPPSYYQSQQQYHGQQTPNQNQNFELPQYKPQAGEGDAGYYDGNRFMANHNQGSGQDYSSYSPYGASSSNAGVANSNNYAPPEGPPPGSSSANQYAPPEGPPPGHDSISAPEKARFKN